MRRAGLNMSARSVLDMAVCWLVLIISIPLTNGQDTTEPVVTEEDIRQELLRLEGQRILEKLRLDKPPEIRVDLRDLPVPVVKRLGDTYSNEHTLDPNDDAPGRLKSLYILGKRPRRGRGRSHKCTTHLDHPAACIEFELNSKSVSSTPVLHAALWINLECNDNVGEENVSHSNPLHFSISSLHRHDHVESIDEDREILWSASGEWISINLTDYIKNQLISHGRQHRITLQISCVQNTCVGYPPILFSHTGRRGPFLEIQTHRNPISPQNDSRQKRSKLCRPSSTSETDCCMETLWVNFTEIGWNTWILQPRGYETGYCKGRCYSTATRNYNAIMRAVIQRRKDGLMKGPMTTGPARYDPEMAPCCSPFRMLPLEILYAKVENNHEELSTAVLPSMIVDSCRC